MKKMELVKKFAQHYEGYPRLFQAPGRVNLIGEHTDYNDGYVFPMAIDRYTSVAVRPRSDQVVNIWSENLEQKCTINLNDTLKPRNDWSDYVVGVIWTLMSSGVALCGADIYIESDVPVGSGLSSSAALEVSTAYSLINVNNHEMDKTTLAKLCQKAENEFVGMKCGIMDQFIACHGKADHALFLDCRSLDFEWVPLPTQSVRVVVCNTMVKHELGTSEYNKRRSECEQGVSIMKEQLPHIKALRDVSSSQFETLSDSLPETVRRRCKHVILEDERVLESMKVLRDGNSTIFGDLMNASHSSLRNDYEVSCQELDTMVDIAREMPWVHGARMTGGGFGGCTVNLINQEKTDEFCRTVALRYESAVGINPDVYVCVPSQGVHEIIN